MATVQQQDVFQNTVSPSDVAPTKLSLWETYKTSKKFWIAIVIVVIVVIVAVLYHQGVFEGESYWGAPTRDDLQEGKRMGKIEKALQEIMKIQQNVFDKKQGGG